MTTLRASILCSTVLLLLGATFYGSNHIASDEDEAKVAGGQPFNLNQMQPMDFQSVVVGSRIYVAARGLVPPRREVVGVWEVDPANGYRSVPLPAIPDSQLDRGVPIIGVVVDGKPCFSFANPGPLARAECFDVLSGGWKPLTARNSKNHSSVVITDMRSQGGIVYSVQRSPGSKETTVNRLVDDRWEQIGTKIFGQGTFVLIDGSSATSDAPASVTIQSGKGQKARRFLLELNENKWRRASRVLVDGEGSAITGSMRGEGMTVMPVVNSANEGTPWRFGLRIARDDAAWRKLRPQVLNRGDGDAQGGLQLVEDRIWASWIEVSASSSRLQLDSYVALVSVKGQTVQSPVSVWSGEMGFPVLPTVLRVLERDHVVYAAAEKSNPTVLKIMIRQIGGRAEARKIVPSLTEGQSGR